MTASLRRMNGTGMRNAIKPGAVEREAETTPKAINTRPLGSKVLVKPLESEKPLGGFY